MRLLKVLMEFVKGRERKMHISPYPLDTTDLLPIYIKDFRGEQEANHVHLIWEVKGDIKWLSVYRAYHGAKPEMIAVLPTETEYRDYTITASAYYHLVTVSNSGGRIKHKVIYIEYDAKDC